jgi:hypothetical protein
MTQFPTLAFLPARTTSKTTPTTPTTTTTRLRIGLVIVTVRVGVLEFRLDVVVWSKFRSEFGFRVEVEVRFWFRFRFFVVRELRNFVRA